MTISLRAAKVTQIHLLNAQNDARLNCPQKLEKTKTHRFTDRPRRNKTTISFSFFFNFVSAMTFKKPKSKTSTSSPRLPLWKRDDKIYLWVGTDTLFVVLLTHITTIGLQFSFHHNSYRNTNILSGQWSLHMLQLVYYHIAKQLVAHRHFNAHRQMIFLRPAIHFFDQINI